MGAHAVTLHLPESLYDHLLRRAKSARRSLEAELLRIVEASTPVEERLPPELEKEVEALEAFSDDELWQAARRQLTAAESARLESLNLKRQDRGINAEENTELSRLLSQYERAVVIRAEAARVLMDRGHDTSGLFARR